MLNKDDIRIITFCHWSAIHQTDIRGVNDSPQARFGSDLYGTVYLLSDIGVKMGFAPVFYLTIYVMQVNFTLNLNAFPFAPYNNV